MEENLYIRPPFREDETTFLGIADVGLGKDLGTATATAMVERTTAPVRVRTDELDHEEREVYLEVINRTSEQLVTVIELLSPTNKEHPEGRAQYLKKRNALLASNTHLVEIDLLRGGLPMPVKNRPSCDYSCFVSRAQERPEGDFWPILLREPLPKITIPLAAGDAEAELDLMDCLHTLYDDAGYGYYAYKHPLVPPLRPEDQAWAEEIVRMAQPGAVASAG